MQWRGGGVGSGDLEQVLRGWLVGGGVGSEAGHAMWRVRHAV